MINNEELNQNNINCSKPYCYQHPLPEHQPIAINSLNKAVQFNAGASIPEFSFKYADGLFHPEELKGQWVDITFSRPNVSAVSRNDAIQELQKRFEGKLPCRSCGS